jgi:uncharacterized membrane protein SirB2
MAISSASGVARPPSEHRAGCAAQHGLDTTVLPYAMFSYQFYKVVHIVGIVLAVSALGGAAAQAMLGGNQRPRPSRRLLAGLHGLGVFLVLLGGFGLLARIGILHGAHFPGWLWVKLVIWAVVAIGLFVPSRRPGLARPLLFALPVLGGLAAYMAIYKPF